LLVDKRVAKTKGIRHRLLTILVLGVLVSGLSLAALVHLLSTTTRNRAERAREAALEEVAELAVDPHTITEPPVSAIIGMRGGTWNEASAPRRIPSAWVPALRRAIGESRETGQPATLDVTLDASTLVVASRALPDGNAAWAGFLVRPLPSLRTWQWIVMLLALATAGLVATTVYAIVTVQRSAAALRTALAALATDLSAPIPRPQMQELSSVAEGVARLAESLAQSRNEEERLERELAKQERLVALGRVAAGVAHEVRNPLASIKLRLDLAAAEVSLPESAQKAISHATSEIGRLDRLVADLLLVAGRASGPRRSFALGALVRDRVESLTPWARERGVSFDVAGDANVEANADSVTRAVDNLLRNAVEASPRGEAVEVRVEAASDHVVVAIEDRGSGVPAEHALSLFEPFFTTKPDGTGLGLALSRAIARAHGGDASYSRLPSSTRFELTFRPAGAGDTTFGTGTKPGERSVSAGLTA
jgi:signal transduction histidine kinase